MPRRLRRYWHIKYIKIKELEYRRQCRNKVVCGQIAKMRLCERSRHHGRPDPDIGKAVAKEEQAGQMDHTVPLPVFYFIFSGNPDRKYGVEE